MEDARKARALLHATQDMLYAVFNSLPTSQEEEILEWFTRDNEDAQGLMLADPDFSDKELDDGETATEFVRKSMALLIGRKR